MNVKILVAMHKSGFMSMHKQYLPVHVGSSISNEKLLIQTDNTGDNISRKNGSYCELTALYWAWKNLKDIDIIGLCHYRRYFNFYDAEQWPIENREETDFERFALDIPVGKLKSVNKGKIIVPAPWFFKDTLHSQFCQNHSYHDYDALRNIVLSVNDKYSEAFCNVMEKGIKLHPFNMFIMRWCDFDDMCSWLFDLLEKYEQVTDVSCYSMEQKRLYGFVSERLLNVWYLANEKKLIEVPVTMFADGAGIGMSKFNYLKDGLKCSLSRFILDRRMQKFW